MFGLSSSDWRDLVLSVNVHRKERRLLPAQAGVLLDRALSNADIAKVAQALGFEDLTTLRKIHRIHDLPPDLALLVGWGTRRAVLSMSTAFELMRLGKPELIREAFVKAIEHELTRDECRQLVQIHDRSGKPVAECVEKVLLSRPKIERTELILGSLVSEMSRSVAQELGDEEATKKLKLLLARHYPKITVRAARVVSGRFSLLFNPEDAQRLRSALGTDTVEVTITRLFETLQATK